jgi:hypothetical protein
MSSEASPSGSKTESSLEEGIFYMDNDDSKLKPIEEGSLIEAGKLKDPYDDQLKVPFIAEGKKIEIVPANQQNGNAKTETDDESDKIFGKLIGNLQNLADSLSVRSENSGLPNKSKQLNFRSREEIITDNKDKDAVELRKPNKKESRLPLLQIKRPDNLSIKKYSPGGDPAQIFYESEKLLDGKLNAFGNIKWSDVNSVTSPSTTTPESGFAR